jgi:hypothetical protein
LELLAVPVRVCVHSCVLRVLGCAHACMCVSMSMFSMCQCVDCVRTFGSPPWYVTRAEGWWQRVARMQTPTSSTPTHRHAHTHTIRTVHRS